jgi:hypothetical protein
MFPSVCQRKGGQVVGAVLIGMALQIIGCAVWMPLTFLCHGLETRYATISPPANWTLTLNSSSAAMAA